MTDEKKKDIETVSSDLKKSEKKESPSLKKDQIDKNENLVENKKLSEENSNINNKKAATDNNNADAQNSNNKNVINKQVEQVEKISANEKVSENKNQVNKEQNKDTPAENRKILKKSVQKKKDVKTDSIKDDSNEKKKNVEPESDNGDLVEKLVSINRVAKVVKGGRRFSFAALVVVGDGNGMVGHGKGKAKEVPEAIKKATDEAKNNMIRVPLRQGRTLHHDIYGRYDSGKVYLRSAPSGTGVIAGGPMRAVFEALGIQDIVAKSVGTSNPHNMVRATFQALKEASSPKIIAIRRGLKINEITKRRKGDKEVSDAKN